MSTTIDGTAGITFPNASVQLVAALPASVVVSNRTSNTILAAADLSTLINITSGTFSQTFTAAATLGSGWFCYIKNAGTGYITLDPNSTELIDGLSTYVMYPGETRLVQCTGAAFNSIILTSFYLTLTTTLNPFVVPPGYNQLNVQLHGGGAGGNGGRGNIGSTEREGGGGGGGGGLNLFPVRGVAGGTSITVTIGAGGTGGAGGLNTTGGIATVGGNTSFGSYGSAYGGGRSTSWSDGGGGGGIYGAGTTTGGSPKYVVADNSIGLFITGNGGKGFSTGFGGGQACANRSGLNQGTAAGYSQVGVSEYGGSGGSLGSPYAGQTPFGGASSVFGATGGGGGGGIDTANANFSGTAGGGLMPSAPTTADQYQGTGAAGGASGVAGTAGSVLASPYGSGGGGGGGGRGAVGGAGATPGGGGGGGGGDTTTGAAGGAGGGGQAIIWGVL
jgi:hypothetical protein